MIFNYLFMLTLLLGVPVTCSDAKDWTIGKKAIAMLWMISVDACILAVAVN
jgi:hypothetical protein